MVAPRTTAGSVFHMFATCGTQSSFKMGNLWAFFYVFDRTHNPFVTSTRSLGSPPNLTREACS